MKRLAILICTLNEPFYIERIKRLIKELERQTEKIQDQVNYHIHDAGRSMTTGQKRNELIKNTDSEYFVFIDSDDMVVPDYVQSVLTALASSPDCVTYKGWMTTNGQRREDWTIKLGSDYVTRGGHHYRWPNHISVMKRDLVSGVLFPHITTGEDYEWSKRIHDRQLLKTEVHIDRPMYHYDFDTNKGKVPNVKITRLR